MKVYLFSYLIICVIAITAVSCGKDGADYRTNYVESYTEPWYAYIRNDENSPRLFSFSFEGRTYTDGEKFDELSAYYGDTHFCRETCDRVDVLADSISSIDITCDMDFDNDHPKGSSLSDMFVVCLNSYYSYIQSGYIELSADSYNTGNTVLYGTSILEADDISFTNTKMVSTVLNKLYLVKAPSNPGRYTFTFVFHFSQRDIKASCSTEFE